MNKTWTVSILAALLPLSVVAGASGEEMLPRKEHADTAFSVHMAQDGVIPIDLEEASQQHDVALPTQPVHMAADSMVVRNADGYIQARGNVDIQQGMDELHTSYVEGNTKTQIYHTPGPVVQISGDNALVGTDVTYNSSTQNAMMKTIDGFMGPETYIRGTGAELVNGTGYIAHGLITTPHAVAKTPDYYLTGDDIRIYPGEKFTSENTKLWFKHICLFTYGHYEGRLDSDSGKNWLFTLLPRPTYNSDDGVGLKGHADIPMNRAGDLSLNIDYTLSTKNGFKPSAKIAKNTQIGTCAIGYGCEECTDKDDNIWATKWPELEYFAPRLQLGDTGVYIDASANWGRWSESGADTGSHKGFRTEISHKPIPLWKRANLRFFAGYRRDWYSVDDAQRRDPYSGVILNQGINDRLWTSFWYKKHNVSGYTPYRFDTIDDPRQKGFSVGYILTPRDTVIFSLAQNLDTNDITDRNYTGFRDLHSYTAIVTYKQVDKSWEVKIRAKDFD